MLSFDTAIYVCLVLVVWFVASLYIYPIPRGLTRDSDIVILNRFRSVFIACVSSLVFVYFVLYGHSEITIQEFFCKIGLNPMKALHSTVMSLILSYTLFLGPISMSLLDTNLWTFLETPFIDDPPTLIWWRNFVIGPFAEELVFRGCMVCVLSDAGFTTIQTIVVAPLLFGLAHLHHGYELYIQKGSSYRALRESVLIVLVQFAYTTVFGWFVTYLTIKTGMISLMIESIAGPFAAHVFCNYMGLPELPYSHGKIKCKFIDF